MRSEEWQGYRAEIRGEKKKVVSDDGSLTLFSEEFGEAYHSPKDGALHESLTKHVKPALGLQGGKSSLKILDICFGLGYNTFATIHYVKTHRLPVKIHIVSPEFDEALVRSLKEFTYPPQFDDLRPVIEALSNDFFYEDEQFKVEVRIGDARKILSSDTTQSFDIIYQDAFSPKVNPLLWTREWFADIRSHCKEDAVLTTYSVAAVTRMGLHENGFELHYFDAPGIRRALIASPQRIESLEWIDMALKIGRNPDARSLRDSELSV